MTTVPHLVGPISSCKHNRYCSQYPISEKGQCVCQTCVQRQSKRIWREYEENMTFPSYCGRPSTDCTDPVHIPIKRQAAELSLAVTVPEPSAQKAFATRWEQCPCPSPLATAVVTAGRRLQRGCHHKAQGRSSSKGDMRAGLVIKEEKAEITILEADSSCPKRI